MATIADRALQPVIGATPVVMSWSGGKDSCVALQALQQSPACRIAHLLTTVTSGYDRISMHGVRTELLDRQAVALGLEVQHGAMVVSFSNRCFPTSAVAIWRAIGTDVHVALVRLYIEKAGSRTWRRTSWRAAACAIRWSRSPARFELSRSALCLRVQ